MSEEKRMLEDALSYIKKTEAKYPNKLDVYDMIIKSGVKIVEKTKAEQEEGEVSPETEYNLKVVTAMKTTYELMLMQLTLLN